MLNETQRNFRKQMKELEKKNKEQENKGFYSYIERDYVYGYYNKRSKFIKRASFGIGGILVFLWTAYCAYTWLDPILYSTMGIRLPRIEYFIPTSYNMQTKKQQAIYEYLKKTSELNVISNNLLNEAVKEFNKRNRNYSIESPKKQISDINNNIIKLSVPEEIKEYHGLIINRNSIALIIIELINNAKFVGYNKELSDSINLHLNRYNALNVQYNEKLISGLKKANMAYVENPDGTIQYWYNK